MKHLQLKKEASALLPVSLLLLFIICPLNVCLYPILEGFHSNTERGFLAAVMKRKLQNVLTDEWAKVDSAEKDSAEGFSVGVSEADRDPYEIW